MGSHHITGAAQAGRNTFDEGTAGTDGESTIGRGTVGIVLENDAADKAGEGGTTHIPMSESESESVKPAELGDSIEMLMSELESVKSCERSDTERLESMMRLGKD